MKKISIIKTLGIFLGGLFVSLIIMQCTKVGVNADVLDRSLGATPDSAVFSPFYDETIIGAHDVTPDVNDVIVSRGVKTIVKEYCATSSCHGGSIAPNFLTYSDIMKYVTPGNPEGSKLFEYITTNDFNKAMPPINSNHELSLTDKTRIYNWIRNGAKETPVLLDFRAPAIRLIVDGCGSARCHNQAWATGSWAQKGFLGTLASSDTTTYTFTEPGGTVRTLPLLVNETKRAQVWGAYKDSIRKFYADTLANASFKPYKTYANGTNSTRGPLNSYDDILLDIWYPKSVRSSTVKNNHLNATSSLVTRIDSSLLLANPFTGVFATSPQGDMAFGDGGLKPAEIALIKAWYFADPNIPNVWKYGTTNSGIFKYRKSGKVITQ